MRTLYFFTYVSIFTILGLQSIPWDLHDKDSAAMLEEDKLEIQLHVNEILLFRFLQHGRYNVKCKLRIAFLFNVILGSSGEWLYEKPCSGTGQSERRQIRLSCTYSLHRF